MVNGRDVYRHRDNAIFLYWINEYDGKWIVRSHLNSSSKRCMTTLSIFITVIIVYNRLYRFEFRLELNQVQHLDSYRPRIAQTFLTELIQIVQLAVGRCLMALILIQIQN